jgi:succinoglycan biosynthesis protein ExoA
VPPPARPTVDVVVSAFNEERYLGRCLDALLAQDYPADLLRIVVVDGGSTDSTVAVAEERARRDPRLKVLADGVWRNLPAAMNLGIAVGDGEFVAKVDAHGYPEETFIRAAVDAFDSLPDVAAVGGRPVQQGETPWGVAVAHARTSRFGTGGSEYAGTSDRAFVDTVQCGVYRRSVLESVGCFDEAMEFGEDDELNWRLRESGWRILLDTTIRFHYITRPTLKSLYRQYYRYGTAKVRVGAAHPRQLRLWHLAPVGFVVTSGARTACRVRNRSAWRESTPPHEPGNAGLGPLM